MLVVGKVELDVNAYQVKVDGRTVHLPLREFELLHYLMRNAHRTVTREQIMRHVWNPRTPPRPTRSPYTSNDCAPAWATTTTS